jgi:hypothetical protein
MTLLKRIILAIIAALALLYAGDDIALRVRLPKSLTSVTVQPYYAVPQRSGKTEIMMLDPQDQACVQSLFPHMGHPPCWYLKRHTDQRIDM